MPAPKTMCFGVFSCYNTMVMHKKRNRGTRYMLVFKRGIKRLSQKKIARWFKVNVKQHPFILGLLFFIWFDALLIRRIFIGNVFTHLLRFHFFIFAAWLILVFLSNLLKDTSRVKWYLRKRFVFFMLILFTPLGLILLWSGAGFKRATKVILSVLFVSFFALGQMYYHKTYQKFVDKNPLEDIVEKISKPKKKIFLKPAPEGTLEQFQFVSGSKKTKIKLAVSDIAARCIP